MIIVLGIKILFDAIYEVIGVPDSTNWDIAYNAVNYLVLSSCMMHVSLIASKNNKWKPHIKFINWITLFFGVMYASYAAIEVTYLNCDYQLYYSAMREGYFKLNYAGAVVISIAVYCFVWSFKKKHNQIWI